MTDSEVKKERPAGVPEENTYETLHWAVILSYLVAAGALFLLLPVPS